MQNIEITIYGGRITRIVSPIPITCIVKDQDLDNYIEDNTPEEVEVEFIPSDTDPHYVISAQTLREKFANAVCDALQAGWEGRKNIYDKTAHQYVEDIIDGLASISSADATE